MGVVGPEEHARVSREGKALATGDFTTNALQCYKFHEGFDGDWARSHWWPFEFEHTQVIFGILCSQFLNSRKATTALE